MPKDRYHNAYFEIIEFAEKRFVQLILQLLEKEKRFMIKSVIVGSETVSIPEIVKAYIS